MIKTFVKRIWLAIVCCTLMMFGGGLSFGGLDWSLEAKNRRSAITVTVQAKNPTTVNGMEKVTRVLEKKFKTLKGVDYFTSSTDAHKSQIEIFLKSDASMIESLREVGNITVTAKKPDYCKPPVIQQSSKNEQALITANFYSKTVPLGDITRYAKDVIGGKLEKIEGVSYVEIKGEPTPQIQIKILEDKVAYYNISISQIRRAFDVYNKEKGFSPRQTNVNEFTVVGNSNIKTLEDVKNVIVDFQRMIKMSDIADIEFTKKEFRSENWVNGDTRVVTIKVFKTSEGNPLKTSDAVMKILNEWQQKAELVPHIEDNSQDIRDFFNKTKKTFIEAILIVLVVVIVFLGSFKSSITPILAIPISLIATFLPMKLFKCSLNVSTLMAFLLAIGLVVDDAILVIENITRRYVKGESLKEAAINGTEEIKIPIIVMTLTLACVFMPAIVSKGTFGATLGEFAITLSVAVIISGIVSLTLTPSVAARLLSHSHLADKIFMPIERLYQWMLNIALKFKKFFMFFLLFTIVTSGLMIKTMPKESFPQVQRREIDIYSINTGNKHLDFFKKNASKIATYLKKHNEIENFAIYMEQYIYLSIELKKHSKIPVRQITDEILQFLENNVKDLQFVQKPTKSNTGFDIYIYGNTTRSESEALGKEFASALRNSPDYIANAIQYAVKKTGYNLTIDYQKAAAIGCDIETLEKVVDMINNRYDISVLEKDGKRYKIITTTDKSQDLTKLLQHVWNEQKNRNEKIKISPSVFAEIVQSKQITNLVNFNGLPAFRLEIAGAHGVKIGPLVEKIQAIHKKIAGHKTELEFTGKAKEFLEDQGEMQKMFILSAVFIFLILVAQFESLRSATLVMTTAPLAVWGALLAIRAKGSLNIYSMIGIITLIGLIAKHGILFVNTANEYISQGIEKHQASYMAAIDRLRPVLMTTFAMVLGLVPLMFETDHSMIKIVQMSQILVPGLSLGTFMTLFVIPSLFIIMTPDKKGTKK
jgi:multidrug efflux pump